MTASQADSIRWLDPQPAAGDNAASPLSVHQVTSWRERGHVLPTDLLLQMKADALAHYPDPGSEAARSMNDFGSATGFVFPSRSDAANRVSLAPELLSACAQLLDVPVCELRMTQSDLWPKYGPESDQVMPSGNADQRIHVDYPNHTLTHPPRWDEPDAVEIIVYLDEVADCGGATAVVPREGPDDPAYPWPIVGTPGVGAFEYVNDRASAEAYLGERDPALARWRAEHLYGREVRARYGFGSVLMYRHDTWHRGTPMRPGALRIVLNMTFRKAGRDWMGVLHNAWSWSMYRRGQVMERLIAGCSVDQRCVLGFPAPGDGYWNADTVAAVEARYRAFGIDMQPYRDALPD